MIKIQTNFNEDGMEVLLEDAKIVKEGEIVEG